MAKADHGQDDRAVLSVQPAALPADGQAVTYAPGPEDLTALASALDIRAVKKLSLTGHLLPWGESGAVFEGRLRSAVVQACVVTLEPVASDIDLEVKRLFGPNDRSAVPGTEIEIDPEAEIVDPLPEEGIDLRALVLEELALALDPYPRAPGAALAPEAATSGSVISPFDALQDLPLADPPDEGGQRS